MPTGRTVDSLDCQSASAGRLKSPRLRRTVGYALCLIGLSACAQQDRIIFGGHDSAVAPSTEPRSHVFSEPMPGTRRANPPVVDAECPRQRAERVGHSLHLSRAAVDQVVKRGLGAWLSGGVQVRAHAASGRFVGWQIQSLYLTDPCYAYVDLRPGDIVTAVNGHSLETDKKAFEAFSSLSSATAIRVELLRSGVRVERVFPINDGKP